MQLFLNCTQMHVITYTNPLIINNADNCLIYKYLANIWTDHQCIGS